MRVALRFHKTPGEIGALPYSEVVWMFAALKHADEKLEEVGELEDNG